MTQAPRWAGEDAWTQLKVGSGAPTRGEFRVLDTSFRTTVGAVLLAVDGAGLRHLLVPIAADVADAFDRRSAGVHLVTRTLVDQQGSQRFLDLVCQRAHLNSVFSHVADEALSALLARSDNPLLALRQTLQRWRELLDREVGGILHIAALCGLFGELWHLLRIVQVNPLGLASWQGPRGGRHDFAVAGSALEIKTTLSRDDWRFRIHGIAQLQDVPGATLHLCAMRLELNGPAGVCVPDVMERIIEAGVERRELLERLALLGYSAGDDAVYRESRFDVRDLKTYEVAALFPRLVDSSFSDGTPPSGVTDVHYTIDLNTSGAIACAQDRLPYIHSLLAGGADGSAAPKSPV